MSVLDKRKIKNIEYILPAIVLAITLFGLLAIVMATASPATGEELSFSEVLARLNLDSFFKQLVWTAAGIVAMAAIMFIDYRFYSKIWWIVLGVSVALLAGVMVFGVVRGGTKGWYALGANFTFQPAEIVKLATILLLAKFLSRSPNETVKDVLPAVGIFVAVFGVLALQKDLGTMAVYVFFFFGMLFVAGVSWRLILPLIPVAIAGILVLWFFVMGPNQRDRIIHFNNPDAVQQLKYSLIAIGSGQFAGKGLFATGLISQTNYIPATETDFIFAVIGESLGFIGGLVLLLLYGALIVRLWQIMNRTRDKYGSLIVAGIMCMYMFHVFENVAMTIGLMPITGIPLPFVSYGGTNYLTNAIGIGLCLSVCYNKPLKLFGEN